MLNFLLLSEILIAKNSTFRSQKNDKIEENLTRSLCPRTFSMDFRKSYLVKQEVLFCFVALVCNSRQFGFPNTREDYRSTHYQCNECNGY